MVSVTPAATVTAPNTMYGLLAAVQVVSLAGAVELAVGELHTCARKGDGTMACWGENDKGQLGDNTNLDRRTPVAVMSMTSAAGVGAGKSHTCAFLAGGTTMCWGDNGTGQLGDNTVNERDTPTQVLGLTCP